jgi:hypothetical protein
MFHLALLQGKSMKNSKWYVMVDTETNQACDYMQLPEVWRDMTDIHSMSDDELSNMPRSEGYGRKFLLLEEARAIGIYEIDRVISLRRKPIVDWIRQMRDPVLLASDIATVGDRWAKLGSVEQGKITKFRQALRDMTEGDAHLAKWPIIPEELAFLKNFDASNIKYPSKDFMNMLSGANSFVTNEEVIADICNKIKAERDVRKYGGIPITVEDKEYWFFNDEPTRNQYALLDSMIRRNNLPASFVFDEWKTMDGTFVEMTAELLYKIIDTGIQRENTIFKAAEAHKVELTASDDPASYDYTTNWPTSFTAK